MLVGMPLGRCRCNLYIIILHCLSEILLELSFGILPSWVFCCCCAKWGLQIPVLRGTRQKTKTLRVRGGNLIGSGRECGKGFAMLLPCRRGAAFLQLMVDQRICTCVARSNHFLEEVGTPYIFSKKFLFNALEENSN